MGVMRGSESNYGEGGWVLYRTSTAAMERGLKRKESLYFELRGRRKKVWSGFENACDFRSVSVGIVMAVWRS